ncbi:MULTISPECIES: ribonuclease domain-containing protein [Streptomyces]|uniref:ribonuclease domain-containing protein n=1 Tax=Streptomyces TaxID=1883 RepID=UPI000CD535C2|nr:MULTISPECIES: ribonuclease domain-containing protein [Streptomyces]
MNLSRELRYVAAGVFAAALCAPVMASAAAGTSVQAPGDRSAPLGVIEPALPVEMFPEQVEEACGIWQELEWPQAARATDYPVVNTDLVIRGSNQYFNRSQALPVDSQYREYDVNPRTPGQRRDAERLVRDPDSTTVWYTADHYDTFQEISSGCS